MKRPCQMQMLWHGRSCVGIFNKKVTWHKKISAFLRGFSRSIIS